MALKELVITAARPLPVIVLADISGSMSENGKMDALNRAMAQMLEVFAEEAAVRSEIQVSVITFGAAARVHQPLAPAASITWIPLSASGNTPLGAALALATDMMEDSAQVPSRAYRPTLVLVSDGLPNDNWEPQLERLFHAPRASKAFRFAMGIGSDLDPSMLRRFLNDPSGRVFEAHNAREMHEFFRWVTMSVTARSRSTTPNEPVSLPAGAGMVALHALPETDLDGLEF